MFKDSEYDMKKIDQNVLYLMKKKQESNSVFKAYEGKWLNKSIWIKYNIRKSLFYLFDAWITFLIL